MKDEPSLGRKTSLALRPRCTVTTAAGRGLFLQLSLGGGGGVDSTAGPAACMVDLKPTTLVSALWRTRASHLVSFYRGNLSFNLQLFSFSEVLISRSWEPDYRDHGGRCFALVPGTTVSDGCTEAMCYQTAGGQRTAAVSFHNRTAGRPHLAPGP